MKVLMIASIFATLGYALGYEVGTESGNKRVRETSEATNAVALKFGYICGQFNDLKCLESFSK